MSILILNGNKDGRLKILKSHRLEGMPIADSLTQSRIQSNSIIISINILLKNKFCSFDSAVKTEDNNSPYNKVDLCSCTINSLALIICFEPLRTTRASFVKNYLFTF